MAATATEDFAEGVRCLRFPGSARVWRFRRWRDLGWRRWRGGWFSSDDVLFRTRPEGEPFAFPCFLRCSRDRRLPSSPTGFHTWDKVADLLAPHLFCKYCCKMRIFSEFRFSCKRDSGFTRSNVPATGPRQRRAAAPNPALGQHHETVLVAAADDLQRHDL